VTSVYILVSQTAAGDILGVVHGCCTRCTPCDALFARPNEQAGFPARQINESLRWVMKRSWIIQFTVRVTSQNDDQGQPLEKAVSWQSSAPFTSHAGEMALITACMTSGGSRVAGESAPRRALSASASANLQQCTHISVCMQCGALLSGLTPCVAPRVTRKQVAHACMPVHDVRLECHGWQTVTKYTHRRAVQGCPRRTVSSNADSSADSCHSI
jgi:hypothetical protein